MVTFAVAEKALLDEVENRLQTLVPNLESSVRFLPIDDEARELSGDVSEIAEFRRFEFGPAEWVQSDYVGAGYVGATYTHTIGIYYPARGRKYYNIAMSDADQIRADLLNNSNNTTGCQNRRLDPGSVHALEHDEDDNYQMLTMTLRVLYETTAT